MCPYDQIRSVWCNLMNMIEDIDKAAVSCAGCHYELSDVTFCQIPSALVCILPVLEFLLFFLQK